MTTTAITTLQSGGQRRYLSLARLQSDAHLIELIRGGDERAFETLVARYHSRLLAFCRHLVGSVEDAEDVLQECLAAAHHAILADGREINVRPWLYRIARNRCLNHLRRVPAVGVDSMDVLLAAHGESTADQVHRREEFRLLLADIQALPESQRCALILREMDALSYEQIAEAMETTVPSVKSLLVRARVALAEAGEARQLSCADVRVRLGEVAEGLQRRAPAPVRRHVRSCTGCQRFEGQLGRTNRGLAAVLPIGPLAGIGSGALFGTGSSGPVGLLGAGVAGLSAKSATALTLALLAAGAVLGGAYEAAQSPGQAHRPAASRRLAPTAVGASPAIAKPSGHDLTRLGPSLGAGPARAAGGSPVSAPTTGGRWGSAVAQPAPQGAAAGGRAHGGTTTGAGATSAVRGSVGRTVSQTGAAGISAVNETFHNLGGVVGSATGAVGSSTSAAGSAGASTSTASSTGAAGASTVNGAVDSSTNTLASHSRDGSGASPSATHTAMIAAEAAQATAPVDPSEPTLAAPARSPRVG